MSAFGNVPEINIIKKHLEQLKINGLIQEWEIPYEEIITRLTAAIFFITPARETTPEMIWKEMEVYEGFQYRANTEKKLSRLMWRVTFNK